MANPEHVRILNQGVEMWNRWREERSKKSFKKPIPLNNRLREVENNKAYLVLKDYIFLDLSGANLVGRRLLKANLSHVNLDKAVLDYIVLTEADLFGASLAETKLCQAILVRTNLLYADLRNADIRETRMRGASFGLANLSGSNLRKSDLSGASLRGANLVEADLTEADLSGADLRGADLSGANPNGANLCHANFVGANLTKTQLTNCRIYGLSAWDVQLEDTEQLNLIITPPSQPDITVDNLKAAQFIYHLLNNKEIRSTIDTITSKVVLIVGRFTHERKQVLDAIRDKLRNQTYSPVVFNLEEHGSESFIETARTLANMAHFVLVDLTDLDDVIREIAASIIPRCVVPIQPLLLGNYQYDHALVRDLQQKYRWLLSPRRYKDISGLLNSFQEQIIQPAENKITELKQRKPLKVFFGSAPEDRDMLDRLKKHLYVLERSGQIEIWDDRDIEPGINREEVIDRQLSDARIILLLISPDFLASNNCYTLQEKAMEGNTKVIPILLRSCAWKSTPLGNLQVLPRDAKPIEKHSLDEVFFEVSEEISDVIKEMM